MALNRRRFLAGLLASPLATAYQKAAETAPPMRIRRIETVYWKSREDAPFWPHWTWVKIETESGVSAIGETYPRNPKPARSPTWRMPGSFPWLLIPPAARCSSTPPLT